MKVNGKTIVVTGGGNGVGRVLVFQLLNKGARVITVDINQEALMETVGMANTSNLLSTYVVDISDSEIVVALR